MTTGNSQAERNVRAELLHAAVEILDKDGPDALQTRTNRRRRRDLDDGGVHAFRRDACVDRRGCRAGLRQFDAALTMAPTADPVAH